MLKFIKIFSALTLFLLIFFDCASAVEELSWQDCIKESAKNHPDLIAAIEEVKQSEASKRITASALFPQIDANLNASTAKTAGSTGESSTADSYSYGVSGTQLIFDANKTVNNVRAATETINAQKQNFRFTSTTVRFNLRSAFIDLLKAQSLLGITQDIYNIRRQNLELITLRYESGLEHKGALLTAQASLADAEYGISQAKRSLVVAQRELVKEMGRKVFSPLGAKGDFQVSDSAVKEPDLEALVKTNPSYKQAIANRKSAEFSLRSTYANFSPTLTGQAGADKSGSHWEPRGNEWNLGLAVSVPIFEGGLRIAQVDQAKALLSQLMQNERSAKDAAVLSLQQTWASLQDAIQNVGVQKKSLDANVERSKIAQAQYSIGVITFDNWTIIEDNLVSAKTKYLNAQAAALLAEASWIQAKGETLENAQ